MQNKLGDTVELKKHHNGVQNLSRICAVFDRLKRLSARTTQNENRYCLNHFQKFCQVLHMNSFMKLFLFKLLYILVVPNSALAKHVRGRNINRIEFHSGISARSTGPVISICTKDELRLLISHCDTITQPALSLDNVFLAPGHKLFYDEAVKTTIDQVLEIGLETSSQDTKIWKLQRAKRITASSCYGLYTYSKNPKANWDTKIKRYLNPVSFENKSTRFGKDTEDTAFLCYLKKRNPNMKKTGFIIHHYESWIGGSPDGVDPISRVVLEIKCPTGGQEHGLEYLTTKCNATQRYVKVTSANEEKKYCLNKRHAYYAQVQVNMFVLNCPRTDFIVYSLKEDNFLVVEVPYDKAFLEDLIPSLKGIYFTKILPKLVKTNVE